eukprot:gnl/TRDRNA2_/TRDRNA2_164037_c0_seq8.p1 gnl/TRDRNA2_/TRDRNA2_164037_c0~~gnl/TRDRNA2_/TRDRNA2_164037_c0_seq8.p1  ORF type:complete len:242 (-),score=19.90 gnl/TRDRNA2_/TRDRNA2_164037_c0_seq8:126-851(-)
MSIPTNKFTYGEITNDGLCSLMEVVLSRIAGNGRDQWTEGAYFVDIGSGEGKAVVFAAKQYPGLQSAVGIEMVQHRHEKALQQLQEESTKSEGDGDWVGRVNFIKGDVLQSSWTTLVPSKPSNVGVSKETSPDGRRVIVLLNSICFGAELHNEIMQWLHSEAPREDEVLILTTKSFNTFEFGRDALTWLHEKVAVGWNKEGATFRVHWLLPKGYESSDPIAGLWEGRPYPRGMQWSGRNEY